jgi:hypothetical protein
MDGGPPRANAAQLAARKIKEKPKGKRAGSMRPDQSNAAPQWAAPQAQPGEGLFGGSVNAPGTFNFSGPAGGPSFPPSDFGNNTFGGNNNNNMFGGMSNGQSQNGSDTESDRPIDDRPSKKPFGGFTPSGGQQNNTFQMSNAFGQTPSTSSNLFGSPNPSQGGNNIFFGGAPPTPSGPSFSTTPAQNQSNAPFTFGATASQAPPTPSINFGSGTTEKPASINFASGSTTDKPNIFNFGQTSSQPQSPAPTPSIFNTGTTNSDPKPPNSPFSFGQTPKPASSSGINFGTTPAVANPANDLFGKSEAPATAQSTNLFGSSTPGSPQPQTSNLFGSSATSTSKPESSNLFGSSTPSTSKPQTPNLFGSSAPGSPKPQTSNLFGNAQPADQPAKSVFADQTLSSTNGTSNLFAQTPKPVQSSSNMFGGLSPAPTASPMFGEQKSQPAPALFDFNKPSQPQSNIFASPKPQSEQDNNIFANAASTKDLFSSPNKSVDQPATQSTQNGVEKDRQVSPEKSSAPTSDLFRNLNKPLDKPATEPKLNGVGTTTDVAPVNSSSTNGIFGTPKALDQAAVRPPTSEQNQVTKFQPSPSKLQSSQGINWAKVDWENFQGFTMEPHKQNPKVRSLSHDIPPVSAPTSPHFRTTANSAQFKEPQSNMPFTPQVVSLMDSVSSREVSEAFRPYELLAPAIHGTAPSMTSEEGGLIQDTRGDFKEYPKLFPGLNYAKTFPIALMASMVPEDFGPELRIEFYVAYRMKVLNNELRKYFETVSVTTNILPAIMFYQVQRTSILRRGTVEYTEELRRLGIEPKMIEANGSGKGKRVFDDENQENEPPTKRNKQSGLPAGTQQSNAPSTSGSQGPSHPPNASQPYLNGNVTATSSMQFPQPSAPQPSVSASPSKGKRRGDDLHQDMPQPKRNTPLKDIQSSNTSKLFEKIVDSPSKPTNPTRPTIERKDIVSPAKAGDDSPRPNPFGNLPVPKSPTKSASPLSGNMFAPKSASSPTKSTSANLFAASAASNNLFAPKTSSSPSKAPSSSLFATSSTTPDSSSQKPSPIKPPVFGSGAIDFGAQFSQKASKDKEDNEKKLMEKAMEEDFDSDEDDEEEWKKAYHVKRAAELKKLEDDAKNKRVTFVPKIGGSDQKSDANIFTQKTPAKSAESSHLSAPMFGQKPAQSSSNGIFSPSSMNGSRTSSPGPLSSATGSVFDGHTPGKAVNDVPNNPFLKLKTPTSSDSGKEDAHDESAEEDGAESDSENKDPNYQPGDESNSGPGTPASETGAGIASAKKTSTPFTFGQPKSGAVGNGSASGTSTPGGTLFGRVLNADGKDPIEAMASEEKENTQPTASSTFSAAKGPFSQLGKSPSAAADKTWKPDSPIKFGSTTPNGDAKLDAPTLSVTAATPTKAPAPFGGVLFGNTKDSKSSSTNATGTTPGPFSNLFGSTTTPKPSVGFGFGASSTTSSLFPSAAVSATTSRATTPGATTDGDSGVEAEPDVEHHEQLDLTSGGPGEEGEDVLHEVRAKALQFGYIKKDDKQGWETKGVGPLRVLKNKDTKATRILLRGDPSGKIILNKGLLPSCKYAPTGKTVNITTTDDSGKGLETWLLQVKTPESAKALAEVLESNKTSS